MYLISFDRRSGPGVEAFAKVRRATERGHQVPHANVGLAERVVDVPTGLKSKCKSNAMSIKHFKRYIKIY